MPTLEFKGKQLVYAHHLTVPSRTIEVDAGKSLPPKEGNPSLDDNLIIHGDNLDALKALLPRYAGKVNCIYIDPPYNTGNEKWIYNDNVNSPMMKEWLKGKSPVDGEDLERHDKWLCMMWPRLQLLRELLAEDGVIFVSIDDNEQHRLRMVMDEVLGEENFRNEIAVRRYSKNISRQFIEKGIQSLAIGFERILVYTKSSMCVFNPVYRETTEERGSFGYWKGFWNAAPRPTMRYLLLGITPEDGQWKWRKSVAIQAVDNYKEYLSRYSHMSLEDYWTKTGENKKFIRRRKDLSLGKNKGVEHWVPPSQGILLSSDWTDLLASDKDSQKFNVDFDAPKNTNILKRLVEMATSNSSDAIILDSFAGSGTTAHAVLALNKEDGGNRKFILVECEDKVSDNITAERVRRVIKGVPKAKDENLKNGLGGSFTYCSLGNEISIEKMLVGKNLPDYETLARHLFWTATGQSATTIQKGKDDLFHETKDSLYYLIYEPELAFLRSHESALNSHRAERIGKQTKTKKKTAIVFATHKFMGQKELTEMGIVFAQLPHSINGVI